MRPFTPTQLNRIYLGCFGAYLLSAFLFVQYKPFWLDEIIQLLHTRDVAFSRMLAGSRNPGASFLPDFFQWLLVKVHYSRAMARGPAFLFGAASICLFSKLVRMAGLSSEFAVAAAFALLPIVLRYTTEARPYSQGLFFTIAALVLLVAIEQAPTIPRSAYLFLATTAAMYSHPFTIFPIIAAAFVFSTPFRNANWRLLLLPVLGACVAFAPWWATAVTTWNGAVAGSVSSASSTVFDWKTPFRVLHEITEGGYVTGVCLLLLMLISVFSSDAQKPRRFAASGFGGLILILLIEDRLHYYFAARHLVFSLPLLVVAAGFALEPAPKFSRAIGLTLWAILVTSSVTSITIGALRPRENWDAAAAKLALLARQGDCIVTAGKGHLRYYAFFEPELNKVSCQWQAVTRIELAVDPYDAGEKLAAISDLTAKGWRQSGEEETGKFQVIEFRRQGDRGNTPTRS